MSGLFTILSESHDYDEVNNCIIFNNGKRIEKYEGVEIKIEIYKSRVHDWFLDVAKEHVKGGPSIGDYVAVMVGVAYIEGVEQFRKGEFSKNKSSNFFDCGVRRVFPGLTEKAYERLWKETRCGLFHVGFPRGKIYLSHDNSEAVCENGERLNINPKIFIDKVVLDFERYVAELNDSANAESRKNFERIWDELWDNS